MHAAVIPTPPWYTDPQWWTIIASLAIAIGSVIFTVVRDRQKRVRDSGAVWRPQYFENREDGGFDGVRLVNVGAGSAWDVSVKCGWDPLGMLYGTNKQGSVPPEGEVPFDVKDTSISPVIDSFLGPWLFTKWRAIDPKVLFVVVTWYDVRGKKRKKRVSL